MTPAPPQVHVVAQGFGFTECPRWHQGELWFVDFLSRQVLSLDPATRQVTTRATVPGTPGGLGFLPDGTPLVVSQNDFTLQTISPDGRLARHADLSRFARGAANDMLVDAQGRAYVGHHGYAAFAGAEPRLASLLLVRADGTVVETAGNLVFPNGMAMTADRRRLIVAETFAHRLTMFEIAEDGALSTRRLWAELPGDGPDGICIDADDNVWASCLFSQSLARVPEGGPVNCRISTGDRWAVSCAIGGRNVDTLFCATAETSMEKLRRGVSSAFIEAVALPPRGLQPQIA